MKTSKEHLDIDLDFLGEKESVEKSHRAENKPNYLPTSELRDKNKTEQTVQPDFKINWSTVFTVLFILFFIGVGIYSSNSNDSNTSAPVSKPSINAANDNNSVGRLNSPSLSSKADEQEEDVIVGEYSCSSFHSQEASALTTDETLQQIDNANNEIIIRRNKLDRLKDELDNTSVDDYSAQWEIDEYNEKVDDYNSQLPVYNRDLESASARTEKFNSQVQAYNDYLENNCTKRN